MKKIENERGREAVLRLRIRALAAGMAALLLMLSLGALAEENLSLNAQIVLQGTLPAEADVFTVELASDRAGAPMPEGSGGQSHRVSRTGEGELPLGSISFQEPGQWRYTIRQIPSGADCDHDEQEYGLRVSAYLGGDGDLNVAATLHQNGVQGKLEEICFLNTYPTVVEEDPEDGDEE